MTPTPAGLHSQKATALLLAGWVMALYGWTCWFGFVNDDYVWIEGSRLAHGTPWLWAAFGHPVEGPSLDSMRKVVHFSFFLNYLLAGSAPFGYHLVNVLLELANTCLVWRVARALIGGAVPSLMVAVLFAAHGSHAGAVAWVDARTDLIAAAFYLAAVLLHIRRRTWWAAGLFGLALLSKETAVTFPFVAFVADLLRAGEPRRRLASTAAYVPVLVAYTGLRLWMQPLTANALAHPRVTQVGGMLAPLLMQAAQYLLEPFGVTGPVGVVILLLLVAGAFWVTRGDARRTVLFSITWIFLTLLPSLALVPFFGTFYFYPRHVYLASAGLALLGVCAGRALLQQGARPAWPRIVVGLGTLLWIVACIVTLERRLEQWRRNGVMTARIIDAIVEAVPHPAPRTVFVVHKLDVLRDGQHPWAHTPVLWLGFPQALQLRFDDPTLDVTFSRRAPPGRPAVILEWNDRLSAFTRVAP